MDPSATTTINASVDAVYAYVSDRANDVHWRKGLTESGLTTEPPLGLDSEGFVKAGNRVARWHVTSIVLGQSVAWALTAGPYSGTGTAWRTSAGAHGSRW